MTEKPKTKKKPYLMRDKNHYFGTIFYGEGQTYHCDTEKEMDNLMQMATAKTLGCVSIYDFTECLCCQKKTKPKERIVVKFWNDAFENRAWYTFFCSQKCFEEFYDTEGLDPDDELDQEVIEMKKGIVKIWKE